MEKLTINQLAPYLPYGLKTIHDGKETLITGFDNHLGWCYRTEDKTGCSYTPIASMKPILYPISCLTKTITHEGREFIPIVELAKIAFPENDWYFNRQTKDACCRSYEYDWFNYDNELKCFKSGDRDDPQRHIPNQYRLFQKLAEWHINFLGIPEHLYINKETIKTKL